MTEGGMDERTLRGVAMDSEEVDAFLRERSIGVLSLADGNDAYGVPISSGHDGDSLYFFLVRFGEESAKIEFASRFPHGEPMTERPRYRLEAWEVSGQQGHGYVT